MRDTLNALQSEVRYALTRATTYGEMPSRAEYIESLEVLDRDLESFDSPEFECQRDHCEDHGDLHEDCVDADTVQSLRDSQDSKQEAIDTLASELHDARLHIDDLKRALESRKRRGRKLNWSIAPSHIVKLWDKDCREHTWRSESQQVDFHD